ncbi:hypothetical protein KZ483_09995 [Paenibacillus sp. sptzw28]|uniref:hypothetical protein n=1 Tax=Paenibacillus sp. sptzw28 TaxID=715179 RepID=UPI001C6E3239|nr:hypothetical protein [Paenibacillus sp. sptzw28]QYR23214.1 hypothetical protein KZ483_09995 [Paenibacillus sp. sptzw28]
MSAVYLDHIVMKRESKSFTDSLYAVLTAAGLFEGSKFMLSGLTGMAFKFTVHERLLPLSVSAYGQWGSEHQPAVNNLGILTTIDGGRTRHPTFGYYQKEAVEWVKDSLNRGIGAVYWIPEFGVINGYDDADRVFFVQDGLSSESKVVLYDNFGLNFTPFWYCQIFGDKVEVAPADRILESLRLALVDWETPHKTLPAIDIASGRLAYTYLIRGLRKGDYDEWGAVYILESYLYARTEIMQYLQAVQGIWRELDEAYTLYDQLVRTVSGIKNCLIEVEGVKRVDRMRIVPLVEMLTAAESFEEQAVRQFRILSGRYPDLKRTTVPRWGLHQPR